MRIVKLGAKNFKALRAVSMTSTFDVNVIVGPNCNNPPSTAPSGAAGRSLARSWSNATRDLTALDEPNAARHTTAKVPAPWGRRLPHRRGVPRVRSAVCQGGRQGRQSFGRIFRID